MSEQIEIEVGVNAKNFQQSITNIQRNLKGLANATTNVRVDGLQKGLNQVQRTSERSQKSAGTLRDALRAIGNVRISPKSLSDILEVTKELIRVVSELGPVLTLAFNALDRPLRNGVKSLIEMLTVLERANTNFLILRKVVPVRTLTAFAVNGQRVATALKGMSQEARAFATRATSLFTKAVSSTVKLGNSIGVTSDAVKTFTSNLSGGGIRRALQVYTSYGDKLKSIRDSLKGLIANTKAVSSTTKAMGVASQATSNALRSIGVESGVLSQQVNKINQRFARAIKEGGALNRSYNILAKVGITAVDLALQGAFVAVGALTTGFVKLTGLALPRTFGAIQKSAMGVAKAVGGVTASVAKISVSPLTLFGRGFQTLGSIIGGTIGKISAVSAGIVGLGATLTNVATGAVATYRKNWIKALSEIPNATQKSTAQLRGDLQNLQRELGILSADALPALRRAFQIGFTEDNSLDVIRQASKLAILEVDNLEGSVGILGNAMRSFASDNLTAEQTLDQLFTASKKGGFNLDELGSLMQRIGPQIAGAGVSFTEFTATLATLTRSGRTSVQAMQDIANLTDAIARPSEEAQQAFQKLGIAFGRGKVESSGLARTLVEILTATGGSEKALRELLGSQEAVNTALNLGTKNASVYADNIRDVATATGSTNKAVSDMDSSFARALRRSNVLLEEFKITLGDLFQPAIASLNELVKEYTTKIKRLANIGIQIFKQGDMGEFLRLSISVGLAKAGVAVQNFATKGANAIAMGFGQAIEEFERLNVTGLGRTFRNLPTNLTIGFYESVASMLRIGENLWAGLASGFIYAWERAKQKFDELFGGDFKARDISVIFQSEIDKSNMGALASIFDGVAVTLENELETVGKALKENFVPALGRIRDAIVQGYTGIEGQAKLTDAQLAEVQRLTQIIETAENGLKQTEQALEGAKEGVAKAGDLVTQVTKQGDNNGKGGGVASSVMEVIASGLARIGGGGGAGGNVQKQFVEAREQTAIQRAMLNELDMLNNALRDLNLGEVR